MAGCGLMRKAQGEIRGGGGGGDLACVASVSVGFCALFAV